MAARHSPPALGAASTERVDPTLLQQLIKTSGEVAKLTEDLKAAQGAAAFVLREIDEKHRLKDGDSVDRGTGVITRLKPKRR